MFIRKTKSRKSTCFQLGEKLAGRFIVRQHIVGARIKNLPQKLTRQILAHPFLKQSIFQTEAETGGYWLATRRREPAATLAAGSR